MDPELELVVGQRWSDFERAKSDVKSFLRRRAECWRGGSSNRSEWCLQCIDKECQFRIRIRRKDLVLTHYKSHTCPPSTHQNFKMHNSTKLLAQSRRARAIVGEDEFCKPKDLIRDERISTGIYIPYRQALRARALINRILHGDIPESFQKIPALLSAMEDAEHGDKQLPESIRCRTGYETLYGRFHRCFVFPAATQQAFKHCRKFISLDGTHTRSRSHRMVLLIVNSLDGNENILPLAWALVPVENFENWEWFLSKISPYLHGMDSAIAVTISDKQKGLTKALSIHLPDAAKCHCCQHIAENIRARYGTKSGLVRLFWRAARAKEKAGYNSVLAEIKNVNERCHTYLSEIPPILYARHAFPVPRFDHDTSNISESINSHWLPGRTLPAFRLLVWMWSWMTTKFYKRQHQKFKGNCIRI